MCSGCGFRRLRVRGSGCRSSASSSSAASKTPCSVASTGSRASPEAIEAIYPTTVVQTCIVHLIQHSLKYVPRREREEVARDLKPIYTALDADAAQAALEAFDDKWGARFPVVTQAWLNAWEHVTPFLAFPPELRRVVYTTNAIEALNRQLRKAIKSKGHFPNEEAARKLIYLALTNAVPAWTRTRNWTTALLAFKIHFGERLPEGVAYTEFRTPSCRRRQCLSNWLRQDEADLGERPDLLAVRSGGGGGRQQLETAGRADSQPAVGDVPIDVNGVFEFCRGPAPQLRLVFVGGGR
jgi:hypothetical protein